MEYYAIKYTGPFAFIKPWTAVRDSETFSQQFLTPSIVEGIEKKLFPELLREKGIHKIKRHRLNYQGIDLQQERTWAKGGINVYKDKKLWKTNLGILNRGVLLNPHLYLFFEHEADAAVAYTQSVCLCRNEDLLFPVSLGKIDEPGLNQLMGFELLFHKNQNSFKVGHNRFDESKEMFGELKVFGNPIRIEDNVETTE